MDRHRYNYTSCTRICMRVSTCVCMCVYMCARMYVCMCVCALCVRACALCVCMCVCCECATGEAPRRTEGVWRGWAECTTASDRHRRHDQRPRRLQRSYIHMCAHIASHFVCGFGVHVSGKSIGMHINHTMACLSRYPCAVRLANATSTTSKKLSMTHMLVLMPCEYYGLDERTGKYTRQLRITMSTSRKNNTTFMNATYQEEDK